MASIRKKGDAWHCEFAYRGTRRGFGLGKIKEREAEAKASRIDFLMVCLDQGAIELPPGADIVAFLKHDGSIPPPVRRPPQGRADARISPRPLPGDPRGVSGTPHHPRHPEALPHPRPPG